MREKFLSCFKSFCIYLCVKTPKSYNSDRSTRHVIAKFLPNPFKDQPSQNGSTKSQLTAYRERKRVLFKRMKFGIIGSCIVIMFLVWLRYYISAENRKFWGDKRGRRCEKGFKVLNEECTDLDECEEYGSPCSGHLHCTNSVGSFTCGCRIGYKTVVISDPELLITVPGCDDIDECAESNFLQYEICPESAVCNNNEGSYTCQCNTGFEGGLCTDINECNSTEICDENAKCMNTYGSFKCRCNEGYYGNEKFCILGQCVESNCPNNQKCVSPRSLDCECKEGFKLDVSSDCIDVDECISGVATCGISSQCSNTIGSFTCSSARPETTTIANVIVSNGRGELTSSVIESTPSSTSLGPSQRTQSKSMLTTGKTTTILATINTAANSTILVFNSRKGWRPAMLINQAGEQEELKCFNRDTETEAWGSCSIVWQGQFHIFGGKQKLRQISRLTGHKLENIGQLDFDHLGTCSVMAGQTIFLCFSALVESDWKRCRRSTGPRDTFTEVSLSKWKHRLSQTCSSDSKLHSKYTRY